VLYKASKMLESTNKEERLKTINEIDFFFGPSKIFKDSFRAAIFNQIDLRKEPIFSSILHNMHLGQLVQLRKKSKIRMRNACVLIGVADDKGYLEEGQVFVQISRSSEEKGSESFDKFRRAQVELSKENASNNAFKHREILEGTVLVTKNPCSHPGDIRRLRAVNVPELRHLHNVVVFPTKGVRPEQNKMSGGDLDGDVYMVIWEERLV